MNALSYDLVILDIKMPDLNGFAFRGFTKPRVIFVICLLVRKFYGVDRVNFLFIRLRYTDTSEYILVPDIKLHGV